MARPETEGERRFRESQPERFRVAREKAKGVARQDLPPPEEPDERAARLDNLRWLTPALKRQLPLLAQARNAAENARRDVVVRLRKGELNRGMAVARLREIEGWRPLELTRSREWVLDRWVRENPELYGSLPEPLKEPAAWKTTERMETLQAVAGDRLPPKLQRELEEAGKTPEEIVAFGLEWKTLVDNTCRQGHVGCPIAAHFLTPVDIQHLEVVVPDAFNQERIVRLKRQLAAIASGDITAILTTLGELGIREVPPAEEQGRLIKEMELELHRREFIQGRTMVLGDKEHGPKVGGRSVYVPLEASSEASRYREFGKHGGKSQLGDLDFAMGRRRLSVSENAPENPSPGDLWIETKQKDPRQRGKGVAVPQMIPMRIPVRGAKAKRWVRTGKVGGDGLPLGRMLEVPQPPSPLAKRWVLAPESPTGGMWIDRGDDVTAELQDRGIGDEEGDRDLGATEPRSILVQKLLREGWVEETRAERLALQKREREEDTGLTSSYVPPRKGEEFGSFRSTRSSGEMGQYGGSVYTGLGGGATGTFDPAQRDVFLEGQPDYYFVDITPDELSTGLQLLGEKSKREERSGIKEGYLLESFQDAERVKLETAERKRLQADPIEDARLRARAQKQGRGYSDLLTEVARANVGPGRHVVLKKPGSLADPVQMLRQGRVVMAIDPQSGTRYVKVKPSSMRAGKKDEAPQVLIVPIVLSPSRRYKFEQTARLGRGRQQSGEQAQALTDAMLINRAVQTALEDYWHRPAGESLPGSFSEAEQRQAEAVRGSQERKEGLSALVRYYDARARGQATRAQELQQMEPSERFAYAVYSGAPIGKGGPRGPDVLGSLEQSTDAFRQLAKLVQERLEVGGQPAPSLEERYDKAYKGLVKKEKK